MGGKDLILLILTLLFILLTLWKSLISDLDGLVAKKSSYFLMLLPGLKFLTEDLSMLVALLRVCFA